MMFGKSPRFRDPPAALKRPGLAPRPRSAPAPAAAEEPAPKPAATPPKKATPKAATPTPPKAPAAAAPTPPKAAAPATPTKASAAKDTGSAQKKRVPKVSAVVAAASYWQALGVHREKAAMLSAAGGSAEKGLAKKADEAQSAKQAAVNSLFDVLDKNGDGKVTKRELKTALKCHDHQFTTSLGLKRLKDAHKFIDGSDFDGDHSISREEFHTFMEKVETNLLQKKKK